MSKKYATVWTSHLKNPEHKKAFLEGLGHQFNSPQWKKLATLIQDKYDAIEKKRLTGYDNPNWPLQQADHTGYQRALKEVLELLSTDDPRKDKTRGRQ